jgi:hypothetical protein
MKLRRRKLLYLAAGAAAALDRALLRVHSKRPGHRTADKCEQIASPHVPPQQEGLQNSTLS